jgi:hypothetical protein
MLETKKPVFNFDRCGAVLLQIVIKGWGFDNGRPDADIWLNSEMVQFFEKVVPVRGRLISQLFEYYYYGNFI